MKPSQSNETLLCIICYEKHILDGRLCGKFAIFYLLFFVTWKEKKEGMISTTSKNSVSDQDQQTKPKFKFLPFNFAVISVYTRASSAKNAIRQHTVPVCSEHFALWQSVWPVPTRFMQQRKCYVRSFFSKFCKGLKVLFQNCSWRFLHSKYLFQLTLKFFIVFNQ